MDVNDVEEVEERADDLLVIKLEVPESSVCPDCGRVSTNPKSVKRRTYKAVGNSKTEVKIEVPYRKLVIKRRQRSYTGRK